MKTKRKTQQLKDIYDTWEEGSLEYVSLKDEQETLQSLGVFEKRKNSCYNSYHCDNWGEYD